jgi:Domain of unknown function (DUF4349)
MRKPFIYWALVPMLTFIACGKSEYKEAASAADSTSSTVTPLQSDARKRIKSADLRCRVADVLNTTSSLEHLVMSLDGVVEESSLENEVQDQCTIPLSADSIRLVKRYIPVANLTLRIPAQYLDSLVTRLTAMVTFIDYRKLQDKDLTLEFERNAMKNDAVAQQSNARQTSHTKMNKELEIAQQQDAKAEAAVDRKITNLDILDHVAFSTISVKLFQPEMADVQVVANPQKISKIDFGVEVMNALGNGLEVFRELFLILLRIWPLWVVVIAGWLLYRKYYRKTPVNI